jgi:tetratricopeptide (TPR) repeat protein
MERFLGAWKALKGRGRFRLFPTVGVAAMVVAAPVLACIDSHESEIVLARGKGDQAAVASLTARAEQTYRDSPTLENANELVVAWVLTGRLDEAIRLLRDLDKAHPGNAVIAANLGTALELSGDDPEALLWIRESVRRDPDERQGSEWVHVKILEAKLTLKKNPDWLRTRSVVGWREGQQLLADDRGRVRSPADLIRPITYQLKEHTQFVQPPDPVIGDLYLTLGDIAHSTSAAYPSVWERDDAESTNYSAALRYGTVHEVRTRERLEAANRRIDASRDERQAAVRQARDAGAQTAVQLERKQLERKQMDEQQRVERRQEQVRRRQLALGMFVSLAVLVAAVLVWRRKRAKA